MTDRPSIYGHSAHLYDVAFSWDVEAEVDWLLERFNAPSSDDPRRDPARGRQSNPPRGAPPRRLDRRGAMDRAPRPLDRRSAKDRAPRVQHLLEPACGSGRMFQAFIERGVEVVGFDLSPAMVERAKGRMRALALPEPRVVVADMADFDLGEQFDGAFCPINSFGYLLTDAAAAGHLACVARHLRPGTKYLLQVDLLDTRVSVEYDRHDFTEWEATAGDTTVRCRWTALRFDAGTGLQTDHCRLEALAGPDAGLVVEEEHVQRKWSWGAFAALVAASPFRLAAVYDVGDDEDDWHSLPLDSSVESAHLTWHELVLRR